MFALAKQSKNLGAYKMARTAYDKLQVCESSHAKRAKNQQKAQIHFREEVKKIVLCESTKLSYFTFFSRFIFAVTEDPSAFSRIH